MNASVRMWRDIHAEVPSSGAEVVERGSATSAANIASSSRVWDAAAFAENQIAALVRRVFLPGWPSPARQVVFTAVDSDHDISSICFKVATTVASQVTDKVCLVDVDMRSGHLRARMQEVLELAAGSANCEPLGGQVVTGRHNLRFMPTSDFVPTRETAFSAAWVRHRLAELRRKFEYLILHAPPVGIFSEAGLLSHLTDGAVLVVHAGRTRRAVAQHAQRQLKAAEARVIGTVLDGRKFPVPEILYRRL